MIWDRFLLTNYSCSAQNQIDVLLKIRDMWTFNKHKESVSDHYSFVASSTPGAILSTIHVTICGDKLLVRLEYGGVNCRVEHLLINWKSLHAAVSLLYCFIVKTLIDWFPSG
jgi:hypothetical protein